MLNTIYNNIRFTNCINNNDALSFMEQNKINIVTPDQANVQLDCYTIAQVSENTIVIYDQVNRYRKTYKDGILIEMIVESEFELILANLNPMRLFGKAVSVHPDKIYTIRTKEEYNQMFGLIQSNEEFIKSNENTIIVDDMYFIN